MTLAALALLRVSASAIEVKNVKNVLLGCLQTQS